MSVKINNSKYKAEYKVEFNDGVGRHMAVFTSPVLDISSAFVLRDNDVQKGWDTEGETLDGDVEQLLALNFWFICLQKEQAPKVAGDVENA